jgi:hypothetical protein
MGTVFPAISGAAGRLMAIFKQSFLISVKVQSAIGLDTWDSVAGQSTA